MSGRHVRRSPLRPLLLPVGAAGSAVLVAAALLVPFGTSHVGAAVPRVGAVTAVSTADPGPVAAVDSPSAAATISADVDIADAIVVTRDNPIPHSPLEVTSTTVAPPGSYVIRPARTPCEREQDHLAVLASDRKPATQLVDAEDAAVIARALIQQCGWSTNDVQAVLR